MSLALERLLCNEIYKTLNSLSPYFMQELFKLRETNRNVRNKHILNLDIHVVNKAAHATKSIRTFDLKHGILHHTA